MQYHYWLGTDRGLLVLCLLSKVGHGLDSASGESSNGTAIMCKHVQIKLHQFLKSSINQNKKKHPQALSSTTHQHQQLQQKHINPQATPPSMASQWLSCQQLGEGFLRFHGRHAAQEPLEAARRLLRDPEAQVTFLGAGLWAKA